MLIRGENFSHRLLVPQSPNTVKPRGYDFVGLRVP